MKSKTFSAAIAVLAIGIFAMGASPAQAADSTAQSAEETSCWYDFTSGQSLCVGEDESLIDALDAAGVHLNVPDGTVIAGEKVSANTSASRSATAAASSTVVAILYDDVNYGGGSFVFTGVSTGCASYAYGAPALSTYGWNDRASSYRSFAGCKSAVFEHENYTGAQYGYSVNATGFGVMNDKASSWRISA